MLWSTGIAGLALILAPFIFGYTTNPTALWTSILLGAVMAIVSFYKAVLKDVARWEYWVAGGAAILAVLMPFILGFRTEPAALWSNVVVGLIVAFVTGSALFGREAETW